MIKSIYITLLCLLTLSCKSQININKTNPTDMTNQKFDIALFRKNKMNSDEYQYIDKANVVSLIETPDHYLKIVSKVDENLKNHYLYNKKDMSLIGEQQYFLSIAVGQYINYDTSGQVVKSIELKNSYPFSIFHLIEKMKKDFKLDINKKTDRLTVGIDHDENNNPYYFVRYPIDDTVGNRYRFIKIDAISGEFISENIAYDYED